MPLLQMAPSFFKRRGFLLRLLVVFWGVEIGKEAIFWIVGLPLCCGDRADIQRGE